ncbi:DNA repair protein RecO [Staphylospora marina]|uniref:DNA repair protein RecO n=1 Tax=Staphylospora marina TaxID=2490858 RepID=UPI000F5BEE44|nr:DNA repair protein RecO [Staphylospora marina]
MLSKFDGLILKARDYGESHQILTLLTEHQGKKAVMARGSKKTRSRFGAVTEPFTVGTFVAYGYSGMPTLTQADLIRSHHRIRSDLVLTAYGSYWLEMADRLTDEGEPVPGLYRLLLAALDRLESGTDPEIISRILELRFLALAGSAPVLEHCVQCRNSRTPARFSVRLGGFLCGECKEADPGSFEVSEAVAKILPLLAKVNPSRLGDVRVKPATNRHLEQIVQAFMAEHLPFGFKSLHVLKQLRPDGEEGGS